MFYNLSFLGLWILPVDPVNSELFGPGGIRAPFTWKGCIILPGSYILGKPMKPFYRLSTGTIHDHLIFLDIDGTLCSDGRMVLNASTLKTLRALKKNNIIFLVTNKKDHARNAIVSKVTGVPYLKTSYRKPDPRILQLVKPLPKYPRLVIGDLFWTDGRFARKIAARFIQVKAQTASTDAWWIKWAHRVDKFVSTFFPSR